ncbi:hypothetical protein EB796_003086 [Bugula neritina]|uniref:Uncharacterized protein n=1 Tax=Bugula neritina TaxID=10212 RepID=A0A7J7KLD3_BUGNE|nr:hypothetical protein EB796_003086 [Bugula neritina]
MCTVILCIVVNNFIGHSDDSEESLTAKARKIQKAIALNEYHYSQGKIKKPFISILQPKVVLQKKKYMFHTNPFNPVFLNLTTIKTKFE